MRTKQNKTIKILLAVALIFTAFLMMENTVHAKTKRSTYRTINGIYNSDGTIDTADGYCWKVRKESYAYPETTVVTVKFNTHGTRNKLDDSIVKINAKNKNIQLVNDYIRRDYDLKAYRVKYISTGKLTDKMIRERATDIRFMWKLLKVFLPEVDMERMEKTITLHITNVYAKENTSQAIVYGILATPIVMM